MSHVDHWERLRSDFARGRYEREGADAQEHLRFEDGTIWFPRAYDYSSGTGFWIPVPVVSSVGAAFVTVVAWHDGLSWWVPALILTGLLVALTFFLVRRADREEQALRERLGIGLFLRGDVLISRDGDGYERTVARSSVTGLTPLMSANGPGSGVRHIGIALEGGQALHTVIRYRPEAARVLEAWLADRT